MFQSALRVPARRVGYSRRRGERGITLVLVALMLLSMVAVAALVIDLVTLYVAKSEAQRVANAAALSAAKVLVDGGVTADPTNSQNQWDTACDLALLEAQQIANQGSIGGSAPSSPIDLHFRVGTTDTVGCPAPSAVGTGFGVNPQVTVTVKSVPLPLFFSKVLGQQTATVSATALAEGFNPSGTSIPVAAKCVMPWLLRNTIAGSSLVDPSSGDILIPPGSTTSDTLSIGCATTGCGTLSPPGASTYYPLNLPDPATRGASCFAGLVSSYHKNIASCNPTPIECGDTVTLNTSLSPVNRTNNQNAIDCLIGADDDGPGNGQDSVSPTFPFILEAGNNNPLLGINGLGVGNSISSSRSVVTIPIYDSSGPAITAGATVQVIGFVQAFVSYSDPASTGTGAPNIQVLNVSGCGAAARTSTIAAVGTNQASAVPVRLIHP